MKLVPGEFAVVQLDASRLATVEIVSVDAAGTAFVRVHATTDPSDGYLVEQTALRPMPLQPKQITTARWFGR